MTKQIITQEELKKYLSYNDKTGIFTNKNLKVVGHRDVRGYVYIRLNNVKYSSHRLAWLYMTGSIPKNVIDHINGIKYDNRICNLREATQAQNLLNTSKRKVNTSGYKCVCWNKANNKWQARGRLNYKLIHLGYFDCPKLASQAYNLFAKNNYGEFYRE